MNKTNKLIILLSLVSLLVSGVVAYTLFSKEANFGGNFNADGGYGQISSPIATSTSVGVASTAILSANADMNFRYIALRPSDYASSTVYLSQNSGTSTNIVGGGIILSSTTQTFVVWDRNNPYFGAIRGITPSGSTTTLIVVEY
jgi:hypothetical protein